jgi:hypothetical protein
MLKIEVTSALPEPAPGGLTACLTAASGKAFARKSSIEAHPGATDLHRRLALGKLPRPT